MSPVGPAFTMPIPSPAHEPVRLHPRLVERPWGGDRLRLLLSDQVDTVAGAAIGEAWIAGPESTVAGTDGTTLAALAAEHGEAFVGSAPFERYGARVPLLAKLLDAAQPLSVQVHPDDAYALEVEAASGHLGKTEAWLVLAAEPGAVVWWGWARPVAAAEVRVAASHGGLEALLLRRPVAAGDVIVNPAGTVHAVGAGTLIYELQQASDLTYRLYDYGRRDAQGRARELHLDKAMAVARLEPEPPAVAPRPLNTGRSLLAHTDAFTLERWCVGRGAAPRRLRARVEPRSLEFWTVLGGAATLHSAAGAMPLGRYHSVVLPAGVGEVAWEGDAVLVRGRA